MPQLPSDLSYRQGPAYLLSPAVDAQATALPTEGAITKSYECKVRVALPWDRNTQSLVGPGADSYAKLLFLRGLAKNLTATLSIPDTVVVSVQANEGTSKVFKAPGTEPGVVALMALQVSYSARKILRGAQLRAALSVSLNHERYRNEELAVQVLDNS